MSREVKDYARVARNFLEMVADGISKIEPLADRLPSMRQIRYVRDNPRKALRRLPYADYFYGRESNTLRNVLIAGALVGTVALIYSTWKSSSDSDSWKSVE